MGINPTTPSENSPCSPGCPLGWQGHPLGLGGSSRFQGWGQTGKGAQLGQIVSWGVEQDKAVTQPQL